MKKLFLPILLLCLPALAGASRSPVPQAAPAPGEARFDITYHLKQQEGGLVEVDLLCEGFQARGLKVERLKALDEAKGAMAAGAGPQSSGAPHRLKLRFGAEHVVDGAVLLRVRDLGAEGPTLVLRLSLRKPEGFGKIHFDRALTPAPDGIRKCPTGCAFLWMECTSGGYVEACCDPTGEVICDDVNRRILGAACGRYGAEVR